MITKFKLFEKNEVYFKPGDYVKEFDGNVVLKVISSGYKFSKIRYVVKDILTGELYSFWHTDDIEPATKNDIDMYLMKKDIEKYNL